MSNVRESTYRSFRSSIRVSSSWLERLKVVQKVADSIYIGGPEISDFAKILSGQQNSINTIDFAFYILISV